VQLAAAGRHEFAWDGRDAAGARVALRSCLLEARSPSRVVVLR
jgi:hypothetical protein